MRILVRPGAGPGPERHQPVTAALALAHKHDAARELDVGELEPRALGPTQAGRLEQLEDRVIREAERTAQVGLFKYARGKHGARDASELTRELERGGGVRGQMPLAREPVEQAPGGIGTQSPNGSEKLIGSPPAYP